MAKLQAGKLGAFGFYPQVDAGAAPSSEYYWMRGSLAEFAIQQQMIDLGPLLGGSLLPEGQIKVGAFSGGRFVAPPFLDDYIGWLLYAFAGTMHTDSGTASGTYKHWFPTDDSADDTYPEKFVAVHKITPTDDTYDLGEQFLDCQVTRMQFAFAGGDFVTWQAEFLGMDPSTEDATGTGWTVGNLKCKDSVPIGVLPLTSALQFPIGTNIEGGQSVTLDMRNITPGYRDVAVLGKYGPHSWPILNRQITATVRMLFHTSDLYKLAFYDGAGNWNPDTFESSFKITAQSGAYIDADVYSPSPGSLSYSEVDPGDHPAFTDSTATFTPYVNAGGDAEYWITVFDASGNIQSRAFIGAAGGSAAQIRVYKDVGCTIEGWSMGGTGTPASYIVSSVQRYELGFTAPNVVWTATPPTLTGNDLLRIDFTGTIAAQCGTDGSVPDWNLWVINKTSAYTWPT